jgi:hypothetical protein
MQRVSRRFSKVFWITVIGGTLSGTLFTGGLLWHLSTHLAEMGALCDQGKGGCPTAEYFRRMPYVFCAELAVGNALLFRLAYKIGRRLTQAAPLPPHRPR